MLVTILGKFHNNNNEHTKTSVFETDGVSPFSVNCKPK